MKEKKELIVQAPNGYMILTALNVVVKESKSGLIIPDHLKAKAQDVSFEYHPGQYEVVAVGNDSEVIKVQYNVGDIVIMGTPIKGEKYLIWDSKIYYTIRADAGIVGWIPKKLKSQIQHIYKT